MERRLHLLPRLARQKGSALSSLARRRSARRAAPAPDYGRARERSTAPMMAQAARNIRLAKSPPVGSFSQPKTFGPKKPPRLPIELTAAMPAAAPVPRQEGGRQRPEHRQHREEAEAGDAEEDHLRQRRRHDRGEREADHDDRQAESPCAICARPSCRNGGSRTACRSAPTT